MVSFMGRASKKVPISNYYTEFPRISDMMSLFPVLYLVRCEKCCLLSYRCVLCLFSFIFLKFDQNFNLLKYLQTFLVHTFCSLGLIDWFLLSPKVNI